jgi:hypothetical protein
MAKNEKFKRDLTWLKVFWDRQLPKAEVMAKESGDFLYGFLIGALLGDDGKSELDKMGGDPRPEKIGFLLGKIASPAVFAAILRAAGLTGPVDFLPAGPLL